MLWTSRTPAAKRVRRIFPDPSWMTPDPVLKVGDRITLALFDDAVFDADISNVTRYPNGSVGMTAHLQGGQGTVYLSYFDGKLSASIEVGSGALFSIEFRDGLYYAVEVDRANSDVLEGAESKIVPVPYPAAEIFSAPGMMSASVVTAAPAGVTIIDVMVVYTPAAKNWAATNSGIENVIAGAMQRANDAHTNSDTKVYLNLVHSAEVNYTEVSADADLDNLTYSNGVYSAMDEVHAWRNQYSADMVCLLEVATNFGGYGWVLNSTNGSPSYAFCLARVQQSRLTYTVVHEWGHNMGCHHSRTQVVQPGTNGLYSYSSGWQWDDELAHALYSYKRGYCTVMTYEDANNDGTNEYLRVARFSNPTNYYVGASTNATGDATNGDNARTIRNVRTVLANYRKSPDLDYDGLPNEWELLYFGGETNANPAATASNGVNTVLEAYIAGLNPINSQSFFKTTADAASNGFVVSWDSVTGRVYGVNWATNLLNSSSFQTLETNIVWPQASYTDTLHDAEFRGFYKINVRMAP